MKTISRRNWVKGMALATLGSVVFTDLKAADAPKIQWSADQERIKALSGRDDDFFDQAMVTDLIQEDKAVNE